MSYSLSMIANIAECDPLLVMSRKEKADVEFSILSMKKHRTEMDENGGEVDHELLAAQAEINAYQTIVAALPEGPTKELQITKLKRAELKLRTLSKKEESYGTVSVISMELNIARAEKEVEELDNFINLVTAKRATL